MRLLEKRLAHSSHRFLILSHLLRDAHQHAQLGRQIDILALLLNLEQWLVERHDLLVVLLAEVLDHGDGLTSLALLETGRFRAHVPTNAADLVSLVVAVTRHNYGVFELIVDSLLSLHDLRWLASVALTLLVEPHHLLIDKLQAVVDGQVLADVVDDQVDATLEDPTRREEAGPGLDSLVEDLCLRRHEEAGVASNLAQLGVAHLGLDDRVDERERKRVLLHLHSVQVVQGELGHARNADDELAAEVGLLGLEVDGLVDLLGTEDVVAHRDVVHKDRLQFVGLSTQDLVLLKSLQVINCQVTHNRFATALWLRGHDLLVLALLQAEFSHGILSLLLGVGLRLRLVVLIGFAIDKFNCVGVDDAVTLTLNFKVVGNQVDRAALHERLLGALRLVAESASVAARRVAASSVGHAGRILLPVAALALAHVAALVVLAAALAMVAAAGLLHVARVVARALATHAWWLLGPDVLGTAMGLVRRTALVAVRLLVGVLIVGVLHDVIGFR